MSDGADRASFEARERELIAAYRRRHVRRYTSLIGHWLRTAFKRPGQAEVAPLPTVEPGQVSISFMGHASVLVRYPMLDIACDPMLSRWLRGIKRETEPGLSPADLIDVDLILISNTDPAHLHRPTLAQLPRSATVIVPPRAAQRVSDLGFARVVELGVGQGVQHRGIDITSAQVRRDDRSAAYVIRGDGPSVFVCGASGYFSGFAEIGRRFRPDIALLPIGGYAPPSFRDRNMTPLDALYAFEDLAARVMIPIRHGAFALSREHLNDPRRWLAQLIRDRGVEPFVVELAAGQSQVFVPPQESATPEPIAEAEESGSIEIDPEEDEDDEDGAAPNPPGPGEPKILTAAG